VNPERNLYSLKENSREPYFLHPAPGFCSLISFEKPTSDEDVIVYNQTIPVDEWIKQNLVNYG